MLPTNGRLHSPPQRGRAAGAATAAPPNIRHFRRPVERPFTREERERVTILFGGLTRRHDRLVQAALRGIGYKAEALPMPTRSDYHTGREYGDNGMCNPTYFTAGTLINRLKHLRDREGRSTEEILRDYVFITAGGCGPCRFGMYEAEYRLALRNSGFDGFRVLIFEQKSLRQSGPDAGIELNPELFLAILNALVIADLLNEVACQLRPYEVVPGRVEEVMDAAVRRIEPAFERHERPAAARRLAGPLGSVLPTFAREDRARIVEQLLSDRFVGCLRDAAGLLEREVEVDFTRPKPVCKLIGEFWAQTTEGDGNFNIQTFLEAQGAEILPEPVTTWANYVIAQERARIDDESALGCRTLFDRLRARWQARASMLRMDLARLALTREYERYRRALGGTAHPQVDQRELQRLAHPYYNRKLQGGEGHLEVAKTIYYTAHNLAHMVLSLKPFGCLPSTQSDGAQAAVTAHNPDILFLPIETSGEGDVNAHSRVQMILSEAKTRCRDEFQACLERTGYALEDIRRYCAEHPELRRPLQAIPRTPGVAGRGANFILHVARRMDADPAYARSRAPRRQEVRP